MKCADCLTELRPWEKAYSWDEPHRSMWLCANCLEDKLRALSLDELAELIGSEIVTVEDLTRKEEY